MQRYKLANNGLDHPNQSAPDWARVHAAMARPTMTPAEALRCDPGTTVKVRGVVGVSDAGPVAAPISGQRCAWYRSYVQPGDGMLRPLPPEGCFSDTMLVAQRTATSWGRDATDEISETAFVVAGADGVAIRIDPRVADVNSDHVARNQVVSSRLGLSVQLLVEFVLPVGAEVVLLAEMGTDGELAATKDAFVFVSTRPEARIIDRSAHGAGEHTMSTTMFGIVRGGNRIKRRLSQFNRVLAILTAVIVLGIVVEVLTH